MRAALPNFNAHQTYLFYDMMCIFRPLLLIGGGYDQDQTSMGGFQEWPQVSWYNHTYM